MKFKYIIAIEVTAIIALAATGYWLIQKNGFLLSTNRGADISLLEEVELLRAESNLKLGQSIVARFNYLSYEPVVLIVNVTLTTCDKPGDLVVYCNKFPIAAIKATKANQQESINVVSFSGVEWVKPMENNLITFSSVGAGGYVGAFTYQIKLRGSR